MNRDLKNRLAPNRKHIIQQVSIISVVTNLLLTFLKILIGFLEHSQALLADGIHSLSDLLSDGIILYVAHHAHQKADLQHPYGHGRFETVATLALATLLILVAIGLAWDAIEHLFNPVTLLHPGVLALIVALLSIATKEGLYHYTRSSALRIRSDMMLANAWHHRSDAASSIVVLIGIVGTMAGVPYLDAIAAVIVAVMIVKIGFDLAKPAMQELVDTGLDVQRVQTIRNTILAVSGVQDVHML
ncbi:cation transporter, partial [Achromatium sp. WMS3]